MLVSSTQIWSVQVDIRLFTPCALTKKQVSMTRKCHNHRLQTNPRHEPTLRSKTCEPPFCKQTLQLHHTGKSYTSNIPRWEAALWKSNSFNSLIITIISVKPLILIPISWLHGLHFTRFAIVPISINCILYKVRAWYMQAMDYRDLIFHRCRISIYDKSIWSGEAVVLERIS